MLGRLNRCMAKQELNLFKFSASHCRLLRELTRYS
jgi:hypothetical protein